MVPQAATRPESARRPRLQSTSGPAQPGCGTATYAAMDGRQHGEREPKSVFDGWGRRGRRAAVEPVASDTAATGRKTAALIPASTLHRARVSSRIKHTPRRGAPRPVDLHDRPTWIGDSLMEQWKEARWECWICGIPVFLSSTYCT